MHSNPMGSQVFDNVKFQKAEAPAGLKLFRRIMKWRQVSSLLLVVVVLKPWLLPACTPAVSRAVECLVRLFICLFNRHAVLLVGSAIMTLLSVTFRQNDIGDQNSAGNCFVDYLKHREKERTLSPWLSAADAMEGGAGAEEEQIVFCSEKNILKCNDLRAAIEEAKEQINKFQRRRSGKLTRMMAVRRRRRRVEERNHRGTVASSCDADIENLSSEDFRRKVDAFIDKHWSKRKSDWNSMSLVNRKS